MTPEHIDYARSPASEASAAWDAERKALLERCERAEGEVERLKAAVEMLRRATDAVFDAVDLSAPVSPVEGVAQ